MTIENQNVTFMEKNHIIFISQLSYSVFLQPYFGCLTNIIITLAVYDLTISA